MIQTIVIRLKQQVAIFVGFLAGFSFNFIFFAIAASMTEPARIFSTSFSISYGQMTLSLAGIAILILATTKSTELTIRNQQNEDIQTNWLLYVWYVLAGFGLGITFYFHVTGGYIPS
jgi:hypothetical protein